MVEMENKWSVETHLGYHGASAYLIRIYIVGKGKRLPFHNQHYLKTSYDWVFVSEWHKLLKERADELCRIMNNEEKRREIKGIE